MLQEALFVTENDDYMITRRTTNVILRFLQTMLLVVLSVNRVSGWYSWLNVILSICGPSVRIPAESFLTKSLPQAMGTTLLAWRLQVQGVALCFLNLAMVDCDRRIVLMTGKLISSDGVAAVSQG